ncbi:phosphotransferase [Bacteroidia bacterium]|nr:phosphotransferase [Bacteroidia bacterium]
MFEQWCGAPLVRALALTPAGSARHYFRLYAHNQTAIGCYSNNVDENKAFVALAQHFEKKQLNVPKIYAVSTCQKYYLQQDLGDTSLFDYIREGRAAGTFSSAEKSALKDTLAHLARIQFEGIEGLDTLVCYPQPALDKDAVLWDLNYFKYCFLKPHSETINEPLLQQDFEQLAAWICAQKNTCFLYRDGQSRNVMWHRETPYFIDFQGGRLGMPHYDVASFLYQARANFADDLRHELLDAYLHAANRYPAFDASNFEQKLPVFALLRTLQVLGAYGFRGYFERKAHFLQSIPWALKNLEHLLPRVAECKTLKIDYLRALLENLLTTAPSAVETSNGLCVRVFSFSYLNGIPEDPAGNGGGFIFDCRNIENPGRQEEFKALTGLDLAVSQYLDGNEQMQTFLQHVYALVDTAVERYEARGFKNLLVGFGCTGGQHRSVYAAQHLAEHLHQKFADANVHLHHRERHLHNVFAAAKPTCRAQ